MKGVIEDPVMDVVVMDVVVMLLSVVHKRDKLLLFFVIFVDLDLEISHGKNVLITGCTGKN